MFVTGVQTCALPISHQDRHTSSSVSRPCSGPSVQVGPQGLEGWPVHFPPRAPNAAGAAAAAAAAAAAPPPGRDFQPVTPVRVSVRPPVEQLWLGCCPPPEPHPA